MMTRKKKKEIIEMESNWADLPSEIFLLILKKLPDISDFVRCRAVCKPWRFSSSISDLPLQFPWILRLSEGPDLEFYSMAFNKVYTVRARCSSGKRLFGPTGGYILTGEEGIADSFSLLNPLNNSEIPLPVLRYCDPYLFPDSFTWFNSPSFQIDDYVVDIEEDISIGCKPGDDKWDIIGPGYGSRYRCSYFKGLLFKVNDYNEVTKVTDISSRKELYVIPPPEDETLIEMRWEGPYHAESCGEILSIYYNHCNKWTDFKFNIYRLEIDNGKGNPCWVKLSSIGDQILFFDFPFGTGRGFCLRASDFAGFKGNCIYFIRKELKSHVHVIHMYDIENGEIVFIDTPFDQKNDITWFMPTLNHI